MIYPADYVVFDFETTGLDPFKNKIIEIGAMKFIRGQKVGHFSKLINWNIEIPQIITEITGITKEMLDEVKESPIVAFREFADFIGCFPLVGHNILRFDFKFLNQQMAEYIETEPEAFNHFINNPMEKRCVDTAAIFKAMNLPGFDRYWYESFEEMALRCLDIRAYGKFSIDACCESLGIDKSSVSQHRAIGDVFLTNEIYKKICLKQ